jgi:transcriptional antiterminator RfaH
VAGIAFAQLGCIPMTSLNNLPRDHWYVLYSNHRKEEHAQLHLKLKGLPTFFPRLRLPAVGENKSRIVPLFPNYLFVRIQMRTECHLVIWTPGVKRIVSFGDEPVPIDESVICFLQHQADASGVIQARSRIARGQEVEISGGPFAGLMGIIQVPPDNKGRVKVLLKLLSRQISVKFGVEFIKDGHAAWAPPASRDIGRSSFSAES